MISSSASSIYSLFYLCEGWILGCDTKIVCIYKTPRSRVDRLVVCIYVKQYWWYCVEHFPVFFLGQAILLFPPSATFVVQLDIESLLLDNTFWMTRHRGLFRVVLKIVCIMILWLTMSYFFELEDFIIINGQNAADKSRNAAPVIMRFW